MDIGLVTAFCRVPDVGMPGPHAPFTTQCIVHVLWASRAYLV